MKNVILPWPDSGLSPNARLHWAKKAKLTKAARAHAGWATKASKIKIVGDGAINLRVSFFPPDHRHRDGTNMLASMKAAFDGIADALGVNDVRFHVSYGVFEPVKGGRVTVEVQSS